MQTLVQPELDTLEGRIKRIAGIIDEMKGDDLLVMDLRGICDFTDVFIIATTRSSTHMQAIATTLLQKLRDEGLRPVAKPDMASTRWELVDFSNVIVHLFDAEARAFYDLEHLWGDAERLAWQPTAIA